MFYDISVECKQTFLEIKVAGQETFDGNIELADHVAQQCAAFGYNHLLLDVQELDEDYSLISDYHVVSHMDKIGIADVIHRAAVVLGTKRRETGTFFQTACRNRGINICIFENGDDAVKWLQNARKTNTRERNE